MKPTDDVSQFPENGMSTTPRTDAVQFLDQSDYHDPSAVDWFVRADFASELETELAATKARAEKAEAEVERLTKHCSALEVEVAVLSEGLSEDHAIYIAKARAEKAEADTARMDWLEKESPEDWGIRSINRAAIDKAMKEAIK